MLDLLPDGSMIRKLWIGEAELYRDHLLRLDAGEPAQPLRRRRRRTSSCATTPTSRSASTRSFTASSSTERCAAPPSCERSGQPLAREAEAAFSIEQPWQSHGVGSALLERTLLAARNRGIKFLHMACLADNKRMQQLARKFDAELSFDFASVVGEVATPRPTPLSLMREMLADNHGFATAMLDVQSRLLRPA